MGRCACSGALTRASSHNLYLSTSHAHPSRYVGGGAADSDKGAGVVGLVMFDLRRRGKVAQRLSMCGVNGAKFPGIRAHMQRNIGICA